MSLRRDLPAGFALFLAVAGIHGTNGFSTSGDSEFTVHAALSLLRQGNLDLDEYLPDLERQGFYMILCVTPDYRVLRPAQPGGCPPGARHYSFYPLGTPVLAAPLVWVIEKAAPFVTPTSRPGLIRLRAGDLAGAHRTVEILAASTFTAATAALLYGAARCQLGMAGSGFLALLFAFGTAAWSTASRALWQHGPSMFLLAAALFVLARGRRVEMAGLPLALACFVRPTNAIPCVILALYVWRAHRGRFSRFLAWSAPGVAVMAWVNFAAFHTPWPPYAQMAGFLRFHDGFPAALTGLLISPARGLFVYSPVFLLTLTPPRDSLSRHLAAIAAVHWMVIAMYPDWKGGYSIGYRYLSDLLPFFVYLLIPALLRSRAWIAAAAILAIPSVWVQFRCSTGPACSDWNGAPVSVNARPERVWDWQDPPFLR